MLSVEQNGSGSAIRAYTNGPGRIADFILDNPSHTGPAVSIEGNGINSTLYSENSGTGIAAKFRITITVNSSVALSADTNSTGSAAFFLIRNSANSSPALSVNTYGTGWAGYFTSTGNGVYVSAPNAGLTVASGTKNAVVATSNGARLLYTEESSQVWFTDYGFGRLQNGSTRNPFDPIFAETVNLDEPYHVFVQAYGDTELYVTNRTRTGFEVRARDGDSNVEFSYRLVAQRLGFEQKRLERAPWADNDPNLYPNKATPAQSVTTEQANDAPTEPMQAKGNSSPGLSLPTDWLVLGGWLIVGLLVGLRWRKPA